MASEHWRSRLGFVLATTGSAVGLGSIWKFPYEVGANGGGAFILCYLIGLALIVLPLMLAEFAIGHRGQADAARSMALVAVAARASSHWSAIGALGTAASFLILSFYSVIGGWAIAYALDAMIGGASVMATGPQQRFDALMAAPLQVAAYHAVFMALSAAIVARGVAGGIEAATKVLMPVLVALIVLLAVNSAVVGDAAAALRFLLAFGLAALTPRVALEAIGLGFFSIGVGLAVMVTYAAYAGRGIDLKQVAVVSILADTAISFLAGLAVFPIVFAYKLDPASGPGLVFVTLPIAFARMPLGALVATAFFVLLAVAALASAISLLEMPVALLRRLAGWSRRRAAWTAAFACWFCGLATVMSFSIWADWYPLGAIQVFAKSTVFDLLDHLTSNVMLPLGGFLLALFSGWIVSPRLLSDELMLGSAAARWLILLLRYVVPAGIAAATLGHFLVGTESANMLRAALGETMVLQSLEGLPAFLIYFIVASVLVAAYLYVYTWITAHDEFALLKANNAERRDCARPEHDRLRAAAHQLDRPRRRRGRHGDLGRDRADRAGRRLLPGAHGGARTFPSASRRARSRPRSGSAPPRSRPACSTPPRWAGDAVKRSSPGRSRADGRDRHHGGGRLPDAGALRRMPAGGRSRAGRRLRFPACNAAAQEEPCRRRRSWGSWRWGSGSYSYDRSRRNSTIAPSTAFRPSPSSGTRSTSARQHVQPRAAGSARPGVRPRVRSRADMLNARLAASRNFRASPNRIFRFLRSNRRMKRSENVGLMLMGGAVFAATFAGGMTYMAMQRPSYAAQSCTPAPNGAQTCQPASRGFTYYFYPGHWTWGSSASASAKPQQQAALTNTSRPAANTSAPPPHGVGERHRALRLWIEREKLFPSASPRGG